ncbi:MAG: transcriptional regulator, TetR family [Rariglobus sp.]|jgi:AcrR family transcriptional regulator|nr:transcriptional regulator, TetR family [Rariglobus sp.]
MSTAKKSAVSEGVPAEDSRRAQLLESALGVFARFGYRKTSMDEVARAANVSRQGLYLHFANKEDLFRATVRHTIGSSLADAKRALAVEGAVLAERLRGAFHAWVGRYVGRFGADASDLMQAAEGLLGTLVFDQEKLFVDAVAATLREAGLAAAYKPAGVTPRQLAENLCATARGLKHSCDTQEEFEEAFAVAIRITCAPLVQD